ncbi:Rid family hydrolase [Aeromicrobium sp.]|uniref:Rid family hydrolase n=1 Tax=Aeromicrobium sp. TaxID=1871063 RepID=UPI002FC683A5
MIEINASGGGRFEARGSYVRAKRVGDHVFVAGTTAIEPSGRLHAPDDMTKQTEYVFGRIEAALGDVGASLADVVRTRAYVTDLSLAGQYIDVHGAVFAGILPVATAVQAGLTVPGMVVEVEVDAIVRTQPD